MTSEVIEQGSSRRNDGRRGKTRLVLVVVLILLILLLVGLGFFTFKLISPVGQPDETEVSKGIQWVRSIYGWGQAENEQIVRPIDVAVSPDGTIWTASNTQKVIVGFNPDGTTKRIIAPGFADKPTKGRIYVPEGVACDSDGNVYVCDQGADKVMVFTPQGELTREIGVPGPEDMAFHEEKMYVATAYGVAVFDMEGKALMKWGTKGSGEDQFDVAHGIAISEDGTVFVCDTNNSRMKAYDTKGKLLWVKGTKQSLSEERRGEGKKSEYRLPQSICIDAAGRPVVADAFLIEILVMDPKNGNILNRYGEFGSKDGRFIYPTGIAYDPARDWYIVADTDNDRLQIVRLPGSGGGALAPLRRALVGPWWICSIPFWLLILALAVGLLRKRAERRRPARTAQRDGSLPLTENPEE